MNTSEHNYLKAKRLEIEGGYLWIFLEDGRVLRVSTQDYPRLSHATEKQLQNYRWIGKGLGINWPDLDEDLSIEGFLKAKPDFFIIGSSKPALPQKVKGFTLLPVTRYSEKINAEASRRVAQ